MVNNTTYTINFTDTSKTPITIQEQGIDTSTDITLFGRERLAYGAEMNQNILSLLEKFACPENPLAPGTPNLTRSGEKLANPIVGQLWYNSTRKLPFIWNGKTWISLLSKGSIASNWGIITHGQQIPQPVGDDGHVFPYNECVWIVGPFTIDGQISDYVIDTSTNAVVTAQFNSGQSLVVNYLIVGIRNNVNIGTLTPIVTPTVTPTNSLTPSVSPAAINLSTGLVSFWEFEEAGTDTEFLDCVGMNNFSRFGAVGTTLPTGSPVPAHGKVNQAIRAGSTTYFESIPTVGISAGSSASYSFGGWFSINSNIVSYSTLFQRGTFGIGGQQSFTLTYTLNNDSLTFYKSNDGSAYEFVHTSNNIGLDDFNWHFVIAWFDASLLTLNIQIDNGAIYSEPVIFPATFNIGNLKLGSSTGIPLQSAVDQLFYYGRVLNSTERAALWNGGNGVTCSHAAGLVTPTPTPTITPSPTPQPTPTINALTVSLDKHMVQGTCAGVNCNAVTDSVFATINGGIAPYSALWVYVAGATATINAPTSAQTNFQRSATSSTQTGYYRIKVTDSANIVVYSPIVEVQTIHS